MAAALSEGAGRSAWHETPRARRAILWIRRLLKYGIISYLLYRIWQIGWQEVLLSLPSHPLFYIAGLCIFAALPASEIINYRRLFNVPVVQGFWAFLRKRTYNNEVLGYSGEVFLYFWAWKDIGNEERRVFHGVKANNIISGFCSTLWALMILAAVFAIGSMTVLQERFQNIGTYLVAAAALMFFISAMLVLFRRHLLNLTAGTALLLGSVHIGRHALVAVLRIIQWSCVLPLVPIESWMGLIAFEVIITRLPFIPGRDLVFAGATVDLAPAFGVPVTPMLAMVVAHGALERILNLLVVLVPSRRKGWGKEDEIQQSAPARREG